MCIRLLVSLYEHLYLIYGHVAIYVAKEGGRGQGICCGWGARCSLLEEQTQQSVIYRGNIKQVWIWLDLLHWGWVLSREADVECRKGRFCVCTGLAVSFVWTIVFMELFWLNTYGVGSSQPMYLFYLYFTSVIWDEKYILQKCPGWDKTAV